MSELRGLVERIVESSGFRRKRDIQTPLKAFGWDPEAMLDPIGDDAAVLPNGDDYLLLSCDGIIPALAEREPRWSGYCAVLVSVSDIYAMGGRPTAVLNMLSAPSDEVAALIAEGMADGCRKLGVPMVGGHYLPQEAPGVATAILGRATRLLRATAGRAGQTLIVAVDVDGAPYKQYLQWDCTTNKSSEALRRRLEVLPMLAEEGLASGARDISNAGILGTIAMLAENAACGAVIELDRIPRPDGVDFERWLQMFPGYGFVVTAEPERTEDVIGAFAATGVRAAAVGRLTASQQVVVAQGAEEAVLIDWDNESLVVAHHG